MEKSGLFCYDNIVFNTIKIALKSNRYFMRAWHRLNSKSPFTQDNIKMPGVTIGNYSYGIPHIYKNTDTYKLKIGKFCSIAWDVDILVDVNHRSDWVSTYPFGEYIKGIPKNSGHPAGKGDMVIGNDVWIGAHVVILPGVQIGDGAIIGAGSIVVKNVEDYEIVAGNPAKHLRYRFSPEQIKSLKSISWWNWDFYKIKKEVPVLQSGNIDLFIRNNS